MTTVMFYQVSGGEAEALKLCFTLISKARQKSLPTYINAATEQQAHALDELLWSAEATAFSGHHLGEPGYPVAIGCDSDPGDHHHYLINLASAVPSWAGRFEKLAEIVTDDPDTIVHKRANFKYYQDRGYPLSYHDLSQR